MQKFLILIFSCFILISCVGSKANPYLGYTKSGMIHLYDGTKLRLRHLEAVNALRHERDLAELSFSSELNASATTHAMDISNQKRAWNFGSDFSSPQERAELAGFTGNVTGENVSETFEGEFAVLRVWLKNSLSANVILEPKATHIGFGWFQEDNGTIWWVQKFGQKLY